LATLNLGVLAHVDAGKTTLTERLLHAAGAIDAVGRVDDGTTQTDSLALERERGITITSAVASFVVDGVTVNLVDTPGHPDFIAEVERALGVLDGAVLVVSAVEGVQAHTVLLHRALRRLAVPTVAFVNKLDRVGADVAATVAAIEHRLGVRTLVMGAATDPSFAERAVEVLAEHDDDVLHAYLAGAELAPDAIWRGLAAETARGRLLPVYAGAALRGVGVDELLRALPRLLPVADGDADGPASGTVFKIERGPSREKIAVVRLFAGTLRTRDRLHLDGGAVQTVTAVDVVDRGTTLRRDAARPGDIARVHGLAAARVGDRFGPAARAAVGQVFAPPALETAVVARHRAQQRAVRDALADLAEQDPLVDLRQDDVRQELFLSLYGEVQREVVAQTLLAEHGLEIEFRPTTPVCIERPAGAASALELLPRRRSPAHPFLATVGLELAPLPPGAGIVVDLDVDVRSIPIHVVGDVDAFHGLMRRTVHETLRQGLHGWPVTDCCVVVNACDYQAPPRKWPGTTVWDYRMLTPLVVMTALARAGTTVLEPVVAYRLDVPTGDAGAVMAVLLELGAQPSAPTTRRSTTELRGQIPVGRVHRLRARLPDLTSGEGVLETSPSGHRPVVGPPPSRPRAGRDPLDRDDYVRHAGR
jgi:ribosomal protection tetracycline resistance protein